MARSTMTQEELKVLIQDMKRVSDLPLTKVVLRGDPLSPLMEAQCQEREVHLVEDSASKGNEQMHYDLRVLLEVKGVATDYSIILMLLLKNIFDCCVLIWLKNARVSPLPQNSHVWSP
jgi:hypothetical protein